MKYQEFRDKVSHLPVFRSNIFPMLTDNVNQLRSQVNQWVKKGYICKLKRGLYCLREKDLSSQSSLDYLANLIYTPSYIGLETAMQYYRLIPEAVRVYTSVTTKKTNYFENNLGRFYYYHVKKEIFTDYESKEDYYGNSFLISSPEKTLLDFIYLKASHHKIITKDLLEEGYRLQNLDSININKLNQLALIYGTKKMINAVEALVELIKEEWQDD